MSTRPSTVEWQKNNWDAVKEHKRRWWENNRLSQLERQRIYSKGYASGYKKGLKDIKQKIIKEILNNEI